VSAPHATASAGRSRGAMNAASAAVDPSNSRARAPSAMRSVSDGRKASSSSAGRSRSARIRAHAATRSRQRPRGSQPPFSSSLRA
jgi:hypothetical protein